MAAENLPKNEADPEDEEHALGTQELIGGGRVEPHERKTDAYRRNQDYRSQADGSY